MKKMAGFIGLLACSAGLFVLPAATRDRAYDRNSGNQVYSQSYGGQYHAGDQGTYGQEYNSDRNSGYRSAYSRGYDTRNWRWGRDYHARNWRGFREMQRRYDRFWR